MPDEADPAGRDLQLALHTCYGLHYAGFDGVDEDWEWDPELLRLRAELERRFLAALRSDVGNDRDLDIELDALLTVPTVEAGVAAFLQDRGQPWQVREYFAHRSIQQHHEADPYAGMFPRVGGPAQAPLGAVAIHPLR
ncbi:iron-containing redox enzyme family protein, partial [Nocardia tengchongensis]